MRGLGKEGREALQGAINDSETDDGRAEEAVDLRHYCGFHLLFEYPVMDGSEGCLDEYEEENGETDDLMFILVMLRLLAVSVEPQQTLAVPSVSGSCSYAVVTPTQIHPDSGSHDDDKDTKCLCYPVEPHVLEYS